MEDPFGLVNFCPPSVYSATSLYEYVIAFQFCLFYLFIITIAIIFIILSNIIICG